MTFLETLGLDLGDPIHQAGLAALAALLMLLVLTALRAGRASRLSAALAEQVDTIRRAQSELSGAQAQTAQLVDARLTGLSGEVGEHLTTSATRTAHSLGELHERLSAIDRAQSNIEKLSGDVLGLQAILSNKQARGAFGEIQLHDLLTQALPPNAWRWQVTLGNGTRADCVIDLPDPPGSIVIDAKFPLEAYEALHRAETKLERQHASTAFRKAIRAHIKAISGKYLQPGETADHALMFLPSEAVFAELHGNHAEIVREGFDAKVWIVSPTTCMAVLNTLRSLLKDARLRDEAAAIRTTLGLLHRDVTQISDQVSKLSSHFAQTQRDIDNITLTADRAARRATQIESLDFEQDPTQPRKQGLRIYRD